MKKSFESFGGEIKSNLTGGWEKIKDAGKIALLLSMISSFSNKAEAQENKSVEGFDLKHQIELAGESIKTIKTELIRLNKDIEHTVNGRPVDSYKFPRGQYIEIEESGSYLVLFNKDKSSGFLDINSDGILDRWVRDESKKKEGSWYLEKYSKDELSNLIGMIASSYSKNENNSMFSEKITVFELDIEKNEVYIFDLENGKKGVATGEDAIKMIEPLQGMYTASLENLVKNGNKKPSEENVNSGENSIYYTKPEDFKTIIADDKVSREKEVERFNSFKKEAAADFEAFKKFK